MKQNHMTQAQLAKALGYHPITIAKILNNMMPMSSSFIGRFAQAFGFDLAAELFGNGEGERNGAQQAVRDSKETA